MQGLYVKDKDYNFLLFVFSGNRFERVFCLTCQN